MAESQASYPFLEDRPTLWPHSAAEKGLPADIEDRLVRASHAVRCERRQATELAEQAVALARASHDVSVLARSLYRASRVMYLARPLKRAYVWCLEAQSLLERLDDRWRATKVLQMRGRCCLNVGEHERAQLLLADAAERFEKMGDRTELARCYALTALALVQRPGGKLGHALEFAMRARVTLTAADHTTLRPRLQCVEAYVRLQLGRRHTESGATLQALEEYARAFQALPDLQGFDLSRWTPCGAQQLDTHIHVALAHGNSRTARQALVTLARWARRWQRPVERGLAWLQFAERHHQQGRSQAAIACVRRAAVRLAWQPDETRLPAAQMRLADLLEATGDPQGAYEAFASAARVEAQQQRDAAAMRAELRALDQEAEKALRQSEQTLAYGQRLSNVGHLVASVNHELNQPMASIRMLAETALELIHQGAHPEAQGNIRAMLKLSGRLTDMASKLAAFPVQTESGVRRVCLADAVDEALATLSSRLVQTPCDIIRHLPTLAVQAQEAQLVRVIANLVNNALDVIASCEHRRIAFACRTADDHVTLSVTDSGPGLSDAVLERLFQPFFSTKPAGQGLGLGLALSRDVMREMGGNLTARNGLQGGAVFELHLPHAPQALALPA